MNPKPGPRFIYSPDVLLILAAALFGSPATAQIQIAGALFVNVDATVSPLGNITNITNSGTLGGFFEARGGGTTIPRIAIAGSSGARGIQFDGGDYMQHVVAPGGVLVSAWRACRSCPSP